MIRKISYFAVKRFKNKRIKQYNDVVKKISNFDIFKLIIAIAGEDESIIKQNTERYVWEKKYRV